MVLPFYFYRKTDKKVWCLGGSEVTIKNAIIAGDFLTADLKYHQFMRPKISYFGRYWTF
jgi:hypothetical protein